MRKQAVPISVVLSWQMAAFVTLSQASTSWEISSVYLDHAQGIASLLQHVFTGCQGA